MYQSHLITDAAASDETNAIVAQCLGIKHDGPVQYLVFKTDTGQQQLLCCLSGGTVQEGEVQLTPVGTGAYEALESQPGNDIQLYVLKDDEASLADQVNKILQLHVTGDRLCFISDRLVERQALLTQLFNIQ